MPDRMLGRHPRFAAYLVLGMALVIFGLTIWVYTLSGRVSDGEAIKRAEDKAAVQRSKLGLRFAQALVDVSICIPVANIQDVLNGTTLTPMERHDREQAKGRYQEKLDELRGLSPSLKGCDP